MINFLPCKCSSVKSEFILVISKKGLGFRFIPDLGEDVAVVESSKWGWYANMTVLEQNFGKTVRHLCLFLLFYSILRGKKCRITDCEF